jgi:hypothetical protein
LVVTSFSTISLIVFLPLVELLLKTITFTYEQNQMLGPHVL